MENKNIISRRTLRRLLIAAAWVVSIAALYYGVVDWRGRRAWNEYHQNYEEHVASLKWLDYIPKTSPDAENFAATPFIQAWFKQSQDTNYWFDHDAFSRAYNMIQEPPKPRLGQTYSRKYQDLGAWAEAFAAVEAQPANQRDEFRTDKQDLASLAQAAPAVLNGMKDDESALEELRAASKRPEARYPVFYDMHNPMSFSLPHLAKIKGICLRLQLKASAELAADQNENALNDVKLMFYIADSLKSEPFLISYLVRIACIHIAVDPVWEGLAEHHWTDSQLQQLETGLEQYNLLADMEPPLHAERAMGVLAVDLLKGNGLGLLADWEQGGAPKPLLSFIGQFVPSGWYDQEKLHYAMAADALFEGTMDGGASRVYPSQIAANVLQRKKVQTNEFMDAVVYHKVFARFMIPGLARIPIKAAAAQTATDEAAIACGLERYRLANGQFPDNLNALVPRIINQLPHDVITGNPYKYRRTNDGRFVLYSVGWNEKDDGGVAGKNRNDETAGDWVWEYPAP